MNYQIVKNAEFDLIHNMLGGAISTVKDKTQFIDKPFETAFGILGPPIIMGFNLFLGIASYIAELFGYGPSYLGRLLDQNIINKSNPSESDLQSAAEKASNGLVSSAEKHPDIQAALQDIFIIKKSINGNDFITSVCIAKYNKGISKQAGTLDWLKNQFRIGGGKGILSSGISGALFGLAKLVMKSLAIYGVLGAAKGAIMGDKKEKKEEVKIEPELQHYKNIANNVEDTIIEFLDATVANFSKAFEAAYKHPIKGSPEMKKILEDTAKTNWTTLDHLNTIESFVAKKPIDIAKLLIPNGYTKVKSFKEMQNQKVQDNKEKSLEEKKKQIEELLK